MQRRQRTNRQLQSACARQRFIRRRLGRNAFDSVERAAYWCNQAIMGGDSYWADRAQGRANFGYDHDE